MKTEIVQTLTATFEGHAQQTEDGIEYWLARDLQHLLGYDEWRNFNIVITKAKTACKVSGHSVADHFVDINKTIQMPKGAVKEIPDLILTRYACYLVAQNGDPRKPEIAFAQTYFALQTRRAELIEQRLLEAERVLCARSQSLIGNALVFESPIREPSITHRRALPNKKACRKKRLGDQRSWPASNASRIGDSGPSAFPIWRLGTRKKRTSELGHIGTSILVPLLLELCLVLLGRRQVQSQHYDVGTCKRAIGSLPPVWKRKVHQTGLPISGPATSIWAFALQNGFNFEILDLDVNTGSRDFVILNSNSGTVQRQESRPNLPPLINVGVNDRALKQGKCLLLDLGDLIGLWHPVSVRTLGGGFTQAGTCRSGQEGQCQEDLMQ